MGIRMSKGQASYLLGLFFAVSLEPDLETMNTRTEPVLLDAPHCTSPPRAALPTFSSVSCTNTLPFCYLAF